MKNNSISVKIQVLGVLLCLNGMLVISSSAQITFIDRTNLLPNPTFYSWMQKGVADMNNDFKDDIIRSTTTGVFNIVHQNGNNFTEQSLGQIQPSNSPLSIIIADINNDDYGDILTGGYYNGVRTAIAESGGNTYQVTQLPNDNIYTQASAMADINGDGYLDIFVCHDDGKSGIWRNLKDGSFTRDSMGIDLNTIPASDNSGNYGIVFTDFDNDNDIDFYISKCRAGVTDPSDPRRINQLFVNDGNNNYSEDAATYGLKDNNQSWITEFQDIDNDGDMDALIINHYSPSRLMENDGTGHFSEITASAGLASIPDGIYQSIMKDFDNDGYVDILLGGGVPAFYKNNGDKTFSNIALSILHPEEDWNLRSFAIGDLNTDGFYDIYASYYFGNTNHTDKLWLNTKNNNNYLPIHLIGYQGNRSAVGAKIIVESNSMTQIKEIRAGESYGISNSLCQIFGLGSDDSIAKVTVIWPDGKKNEFTNIQINKALYITEGFK